DVGMISVLAAASIKSAAILSLAGLVNEAWRSSSASARHLVWTIGVASALAVPALGEIASRMNAPAIHLNILPAVAAPSPVVTPVSPVTAMMAPANSSVATTQYTSSSD